MANSTFKIKKVPLMIITAVALGGYAMAAILNFSDIQNAWQMILIFAAALVVYAFLREKHVKKLADEGVQLTK